MESAATVQTAACSQARWRSHENGLLRADGIPARVACGLTSLDDTASHQQAQQRNAADRDEFMKQASTRKLKVIPSSTNFVMFNANRPVRTVIDHFRKNNVSIGRPFPPLDTYTRISLGTPEQMKEFWRVWDALS